VIGSLDPHSPIVHLDKGGRCEDVILGLRFTTSALRSPTVTYDGPKIYITLSKGKESGPNVLQSRELFMNLHALKRVIVLGD
jgi:hypothetical protein